MQEVITDDQAKGVIAANLHRLRGDMSFSELARRCTTDNWKCYPATIQQIESGEHLPGCGLLARIAEALNCTLDELLPVKRAKNTPSSSRIRTANPRAKVS